MTLLMLGETMNQRHKIVQGLHQLVTRHHDTPYYIGTDAAGMLMQPGAVINPSDADLTLLEEAKQVPPSCPAQLPDRAHRAGLFEA